MVLRRFVGVGLNRLLQRIWTKDFLRWSRLFGIVFRAPIFCAFVDLAFKTMLLLDRLLRCSVANYLKRCVMSWIKSTADHWIFRASCGKPVDNLPTFEFYGIAVSENLAFWGLWTHPLIQEPGGSKWTLNLHLLRRCFGPTRMGWIYNVEMQMGSAVVEAKAEKVMR